MNANTNRYRTIGRRSFVSRVLAATAMAACSRVEAETVPSGGGWIDAHVHVWTPDVKRYPLDASFGVESMRPKSFTPEELFAHCKPVGVNRIVLIQMSFYRFDNRYMLDVIEKHPGTFSGVGIVDHEEPDVSTKMKKLAEAGVRGFRIRSKKDSVSWKDDAGMARLWQTARDEGLAVCPLINPRDLPQVDAMCKAYPGTNVIIDHFARVGIDGRVQEKNLRSLCPLAKYPTVHVKTSAFYALGKKKPPYEDLLPMIRRVRDAYGANRLMWASDCPFQVQAGHDYKSSIDLIRDRADFLSEAEKTEILRGTAERLFFSKG